ncbi:hypothetical protein CYMTET_35368, partial [Cymbomonas tetramitiformis]
ASKDDAKPGKIRHLLLIRHGQYDLESKEHGLTELGELQSHITGQRLADTAEGVKKDRYGEYQVKYAGLVTSTVLRAQQTGAIIASHLPTVKRLDNDPLLAEGYPCIPQPGNRDEILKNNVRPAKLMQESLQIEAAFRKYVHRDIDHKKSERSKRKVDEAYVPTNATVSQREAVTDSSPEPEREYLIIVCHMNVIRYFVCRALQLPPEAWLRMRGDNCGITEIIIHPAGRVSLGRFADTGHLTIDKQTFH